MKKIYKTMQGRIVDMDKLMQANELMPAIGNIRVNARGDELGPGGKIIRKREEVLADYYENNPKITKERTVPSTRKNKTLEESVPVQEEKVVLLKEETVSQEELLPYEEEEEDFQSIQEDDELINKEFIQQNIEEKNESNRKSSAIKR